jgi:hypothetical protein
MQIRIMGAAPRGIRQFQ